jgi:hypothetical protein
MQNKPNWLHQILTPYIYTSSRNRDTISLKFLVHWAQLSELTSDNSQLKHDMMIIRSSIKRRMCTHVDDFKSQVVDLKRVFLTIRVLLAIRTVQY